MSRLTSSLSFGGRAEDAEGEEDVVGGGDGHAEVAEDADEDEGDGSDEDDEGQAADVICQRRLFTSSARSKGNGIRKRCIYSN